MKGKLLRAISGFLCAVMLVTAGAGTGITAEAAETAYKNGPDIYADAYCVMDADTMDVICGKNAMGCYHPASITKVMTALVVLEQVENLNDTLTFSETAVNVAANSSTLAPKAMVGEKMSVWDCLNGMMLVSGNECAAELAEYVAGSVEAFAELMNKKAEEIGATNTHFTNPHGLDNYEHYTNPYDMALIFSAALKNEKFVELDSSVSYTIPATNKCSSPRPLTMGHQMVCGNIPYEGIYAGKTGRTALAGRTLLTAARYKGRNLVVVVMHGSEEYFYTDTKILLDYAYDLIDGQEPWNWVDCEKEVISTGNVNLREKPSEHATVRGSLMAGQKVLCTGTYADWCRVMVQDRVYYVNAQWLENPDGTPFYQKDNPGESANSTKEDSTQQTSPQETQTEEMTETESESESEAEPETSAASPAKDHSSGNTSPDKSQSSFFHLIPIIICLNTVVIAAGVIGWILYGSQKRRRRHSRRKNSKKG